MDTSAVIPDNPPHVSVHPSTTSAVNVGQLITVYASVTDDCIEGTKTYAWLSTGNVQLIKPSNNSEMLRYLIGNAAGVSQITLQVNDTSGNWYVPLPFI
jgi:hypothetical protein